MSGLGNNSSQTLSLSEAIKKSANEMLFHTLLNNPDKRAKVFELLTQEGIVGRDENLSPNSDKSNKYYSPIKRLQKNGNITPKSKSTNVRLESPSALGRRRALQRLESDSSEEQPQKQTSPPFVGTPKPFERILEGVVAYCEIRSNGEDRSSAIKTMIETMGAKIKDNLCRGVTHVILKDGLYTTYRKAKLMKIHVVSVLWLEAVRRHKFRVPEVKFPAVCADAYEADITKICQEIQKDYDDVIQDELNKTTEVDSRRRSGIPIKFVTNRKKYTKSRSTTYGSNCSGFKEEHNRTEIASPYKHKSTYQELSDSDSYISVGSNTSRSFDIVPCSQDVPTSLSIHHYKSPKVTKVSEEYPDEVFPESNLAKNVKDSFELDKASKIRSPESLLNQTRQKVAIKTNKVSLGENDDSLRLHISITDESNINSTGNRSKSNNSSRSKNQLEDNITPQPSNSNKKLSSDDGSWNLHISEEFNNSINIPKSKQNVNNSSRNCLENNVEITKPSSSISTASSVVDINRNKTRRRTTVGLKRTTKKDGQLDNLNQTVSTDVSTKTPTKIAVGSFIETSQSSIETNDSTMDKEQNEVVRNPKRQTIYNKANSVDSNKSEIENNQKDIIRKSRRKALANVNAENKAKSAEINEDITEETEKNNLEVEDNQSTVRKSRRRTIATVTNKQSVLMNKDNNKQNEVAESDEDKNNKRRVRKLYNPNQSISASQINWDDEPEVLLKPISVSPPKKGKYQVTIKELPKILSSKAQNKTKSTIKTASKSVPAKTIKNVNQHNTKNKRKSVRALNFNSTSSETSDLDVPKPMNPGLQTPSRRSERILKTPAKTLKIADTESDSELEKNTNKTSDSETTNSSVIKRTITPRIRKPRFISSQETDCSENTPKTEPRNTKTATTPNIRSQVLKNKILKTDEESKRRSTLDFVPQRSKKSLEQIRLSQKPKPPTKLPSIVCTRLHKTDVHIFQQIVKKLGGFVVENEVTKRTTHLVSGESLRTVNILRAIARGCWIVKQEWLYKSLEAGKWLEEEDFELVEFSPAVQKCRLMKQAFGSLHSMDIFNSCGPIFISRACTPRFSDLEELVELCKGRFVRSAKDAQIVVGEQDTHEGVVCVNEKWILDSITGNRMKKCKGYLL